MSAIFGLIDRTGGHRVRDRLSRMAARMGHRGATPAASWTRGPVGLGFIAGGATERQGNAWPFEAGQVSCTAVARLDNRQELVDRLGGDGTIGDDASDARLLTSAWKRWGRDFALHLEGDFSIGLWDSQSRSLICARDALGVRPLYYHASTRLFAFSTEIKALLCLDEVDSEPDQLWIANFLTAYLDDTQRTFRTRVRRVPPGHLVQLSGDRLDLVRYYTLEPAREAEELDDGAAQQEFLSLFKGSVERRMRGAARVGAMLSGGLDSSSIACVARDALRSRQAGDLDAFCAVFPNVPETDESRFISSVASAGGISVHRFEADSCSLFEMPQDVGALEDEPCIAPNLFLNRALFGIARELGVKVILDGFDGDSVVSHGAGRLMELARAWRLLSLIRAARGIAALHGGSTMALAWNCLLNHSLQPLMPRRAFALLQRLLRRISKQTKRRYTWHAPLSSEFVNAIGLEDYRRQAVDPTKPPPRCEQDLHLQTLSWGALPVTMELLDHASAAYGIEARFPFFDRRLVEFCLGLPSKLKLRGGWSRYILRQAMQGVLPADVQWRPTKSNQSHNVKRALLRHDMGRLHSILSSGRNEVSRFVDIDLMRSVAREFKEAGGDIESAMIFRVLALSRWL